MEEVKNIIEVENFVLECNDMLSGKFLELSKRLNKFLSVMTSSSDLMDFLGAALEDFDVEPEFEATFALDKKTGEAKICIPSDDKKKIALFVSVLNKITNGQLNANKFLETYFQDKKVTPMRNFLDRIIKPFRDLVCKYFEINPNLSVEEVKSQLETQEVQQKIQELEQKQQEETQFPHLDELLDEIVKTSNQILALLKFEKKRTDMLDDLEFVVNSIIQACGKKDLMVVNGLVIGLNYVSKKFKNVKHLVENLNELIYDYYEFIAGEVSSNEQEEND